MMAAQGDYAFILDASALVATVMAEPGAGRVLDLVDRSAISAVNLLEAFGKLIQKGIPTDLLQARLQSFALPVIECTEADILGGRGSGAAGLAAWYFTW
jgi:PIN domain nuclease of toxin-antitoxin system